MSVQIIEANLPDPFPMGWRFYAMTEGRRFATLVMLSTGKRVKVPNETFKRVSWRVVVEPRILRKAAKRLADNAKDFQNDHRYVTEMVSRIRRERRTEHPATK